MERRPEDAQEKTFRRTDRHEAAANRRAGGARPDDRDLTEFLNQDECGITALLQPVRAAGSGRTLWGPTADIQATGA